MTRRLVRADMEPRRRYLAGVGAAAFAALAGCTGRFDGDDAAAEGETPTGGASVEERLTLPVPESALDRGAGKDDIPAIGDPVFAEGWSG